MNNIKTDLTNGLPQEEVQKILQPFLSELYACLYDGWNAWVALGQRASDLQAPLRARARASFVFDHIVESAKRRFDGIPGVRYTEKRGLFRLIFSQGVVVRFKKLDKYRRSRSIPTRQQQMYMQQYCLDFGNRTLIPGATSNLVGGYRLDEPQIGIKDIWITCPDGNRTKWYFEIPSGIIPDEISSVVQPDEDMPIIRPKETQQRKKRSE